MKKNPISILIMILFFIILIKTSWICGDAFHGFRVVDNFVNGDGLRYNITERVQVQTSNLWVFVISVFYYFTREAYFTTTFLNILLSMIMMYLILFKLPLENWFNSIIIGLILLSSKAFIDFSTSGLENSLTHLLIVLFFIFYFRDKIGFTNIVAVLLLINRFDPIIIILPCLILINWKHRKELSKIIPVWFGYGLWNLFLLFYYGFIFPNTYYLKLHTGISQIDFIRQGLLYFADSMDCDPITLLFIFSGLVFLFLIKDSKNKIESLGIIFYLSFIVKIGGCFMSGRFFALPLLVTLLMISRYCIFKIEITYIILGIILLISIINPYTPIKSNANFGAGLGSMGTSGIADERGGYYPHYGLLHYTRQNGWGDCHPDWSLPNDKWIYDHAKVDKANYETGVKIRVDAILGPEVYYAPRELYILSNCALADAMRSRLPAIGSAKPMTWRIGHYDRVMIEGEAESIFGENVIRDVDLHIYYENLKHVIQDPLFNWNRIKLIWIFNSGKFQPFIDSWCKRNGYAI